MTVDRVNRSKFSWKGLALHYGRRNTPVLTLVADLDYPHLYRIVYPDGWTSTLRLHSVSATFHPSIAEGLSLHRSYAAVVV